MSAVPAFDLDDEAAVEAWVEGWIERSEAWRSGRLAELAAELKPEAVTA